MLVEVLVHSYIVPSPSRRSGARSRWPQIFLSPRGLGVGGSVSTLIVLSPRGLGVGRSVSTLIHSFKSEPA